MSRTYSVVFSGRLRRDDPPEVVRKRLSTLFQVEPDKLDDFFHQKPFVLRRQLSESAAQRWVSAMEQTGALCWMAPDEEDTPPVPRSPLRPTSRPPRSAPPSPGANFAASDALSQARAGVQHPADSTNEEYSGLTPPRSLDDLHAIAFTKCPKCGWLAQSTEDELMSRGECPRCGLIVEKYSRNYILADPRPEAGGHPATGPELKTSHQEERWYAFTDRPEWPLYRRSSFLVAAFLTSLPGLLYLLGMDLEPHLSPSLTNLLLAGFALALLFVTCAAVGFCGYSLFKTNRAAFHTVVLYSLGLFAVFASFGASLAYLFAAADTACSSCGIQQILPWGRAVRLALVLLFSVQFYLAVVYLPARLRILDFVDGAEYEATVDSARSFAGADFPQDSRAHQYQYYKYVYIRPTQAVESNFGKTLQVLLPVFESFSLTEGGQTEASLLFSNAVAFRDELTADGLISEGIRGRLEEVATTWDTPAESEPDQGKNGNGGAFRTPVSRKTPAIVETPPETDPAVAAQKQ